MAGLILFNFFRSDSNKYDRFSGLQLLPNGQSIVEEGTWLMVTIVFCYRLLGGKYRLTLPSDDCKSPPLDFSVSDVIETWTVVSLR